MSGYNWAKGMSSKAIDANEASRAAIVEAVALLKSSRDLGKGIVCVSWTDFDRLSGPGTSWKRWNTTDSHKHGVYEGRDGWHWINGEALFTYRKTHWHQTSSCFVNRDKAVAILKDATSTAAKTSDGRMMLRELQSSLTNNAEVVEAIRNAIDRSPINSLTVEECWARLDVISADKSAAVIRKLGKTKAGREGLALRWDEIAAKMPARQAGELSALVAQQIYGKAVLAL